MTLDESVSADPAEIESSSELMKSSADKMKVDTPIGPTVYEIAEEATVIKLLRDDAMALPDTDVAISGISGRFPKCDTMNQFEEALRNGLDLVADEDESRFPCRLWNLPPRAGRLNDLSRFDHEFFGYTQDAANFTDFQLRILYEVVYESILDAGLSPSELRGSNTGVFLGLHCNEFESAMSLDPAFTIDSGYFTQYATKIAQFFNLKGIVSAFDAACASGFVGFHAAVDALRAGQIERAIVCSVNIPVHPVGNMVFYQMQMLSPTGYSRFLDSKADGYVKSESCVSTILEPKWLAKRNYASIMATMTSVDGYKKEGITFPSDKSQETLIRATKEAAGLTTNQIEYLEAHGTGTPAGDPQEATAFSNVYYPKLGSEEDHALQVRGERRIIGPLLAGSVKTNMGHSEGVSGLCALAKVLLMLENELIFPSLHYDQPNTNIESLVEGRIKFTKGTAPLRAKIVPLSCYGFGGANVHVIVRASEQATIDSESEKVIAPAALPSDKRLVVMFGRSKKALEQFFDKIQSKEQITRHCMTDDFLSLVDSVNSGKVDRLMNYRGYLVVERNVDGNLGQNCELARSIEKIELDSLDELGSHPQDFKPRHCNLMFPGLGSQWESMGAGLENSTHFWPTIERLASHIKSSQVSDDIDLIKLLNGGQKQDCLAKQFVSIVAWQIAATNIIKKQLNVANCEKTVGFSLGSISSVYASGVFDEREAILVAYTIGKCLDSMSGSISGRMIAVEVNEKQFSEQFAPSSGSSIQVSCINGPNWITVSGSNYDIDQLCKTLERDQITFKNIDSPIALHNDHIMGPDTERALEIALLDVLPANKRYDASKLGFPAYISCISSDRAHLLRGNTNAAYFAHSMCKKVDYLAAMEQLEENSICVEMGPTGQLESQIRFLPSSTNKGNKFHYIKLMNHSVPAEDQEVYLMSALGQLYQKGACLDMSSFYPLKTSQVRRQTPSLSSLMSWNHETELFVPKYPQHFSRSSAKSSAPFDLMQEHDKYLAGHCIEGRVLFPATGYLFAVWRVFSFTKRKIFDATFQSIDNMLVPAEFHNVRLMRAVMLGTKPSQLYVQLEEVTGHFEIREGGSVCVEGYIQSPVERPTELLYEDVRDKIRAEKPTEELSTDDVYKQFRINGYDYGESFRNIVGSSADGRYTRVKYNEYFVSFADCVLQSVFLAVQRYAPSGGLFLPTRFEYIRFQPEAIERKVRATGRKFDITDRSLDTMAKREAMTKILERDSTQNQTEAEIEKAKAEAEAERKRKEEEAAARPDCIFEVFCDPITGVIITDGMEMRGVRAAPAPRRVDTNDVLLESYQFVKDVELPICDKLVEDKDELDATYVKVCDSMSVKLLENICKNQIDSQMIANCDANIANDIEIEAYKAKNLKQLFKGENSDDSDPKNESTKAIDTEDQAEVKDAKKGDKKKKYDIKENGDRMLLSVLDQLADVSEAQEVKRIVKENRQHLMADLIQNSLLGERFVRPLAETIIENICKRKMKLQLIEINVDDGVMVEPLSRMLQQIEPQLTLDYSLAHPDVTRISASKLSMANSDQQVKTHTMKDLSSLYAENKLKDFDLIVYKDISCYSLPKQVIEKNGLRSVMDTLNNIVHKHGFVLLMMREKLSLAERVLLSLSEPQLVGLSEQDLEQISISGSSESAQVKINSINSILAARCELMLSEAKRNEMICVSQKSDKNGCLALLFRTSTVAKNTTSAERANQTQTIEQVILRVDHEDPDSVRQWLEPLKLHFKKPEEPKEEDKDKKKSESEPTAIKDAPANPASKSEPADTQKADKVFWLCAVATKRQPINGLIGMMQALRKELGSSSLRCFYDAHTFKDCDGPVSVSDIQNCKNFREALNRDMIWNCVDERGNWGTFRHFTINDYLSSDKCLCADQEAKKETKMSFVDEPKAVFASNAIRGDLSTFTWYESPHNFLTGDEKSKLVRIAYSALNFRDIMFASGRLPLDVLPIQVAMSDCMIGFEFSGVDARGRRVMGMVPHRAIGSEVLCSEENSILVEVPDWMSLKEAATIPVVYATALLSLIYRGKMRRGESILIHAGSGGVGQAAIRIASYFGLEIYTTVGSAEKRKFLLEEFPNSLDESHIFSSRDCTFEQDIMRATRGYGVDLVLNSLADDKLQASVRCLADGGRFLEIGKYDLAMDTQFELLRLDTNKSFHGILLDKLFDHDVNESFKAQLKVVMRTLQDGFDKGYVKPIKHHVFKTHQIEEAFRFMATGKHMGKVLIEIDDHYDAVFASDNQERHQVNLLERPLTGFKYVPRVQLAPHKSYIVTGGLGGFGLELCKWLVAQGARNLLLTSRTGCRTGYQKMTLRRLERANNCRVRVVTLEEANTTKLDGCKKLYELALDWAPERQIGGIFHLAMVLKDTLLENMSVEDFELVCEPKLRTCQHLHELTIGSSNILDHKLDYFVCFSSVTSGKGNAGQSNYAYANSFVERICEKRRAQNQHGLAIQWGAIGDVGVAFENLGGNDVIVGGTIPQRMPSCQATLTKLLSSPFAVCLSVVPANRGAAGVGQKGDLVAAIFHVLGIKDPSKVSDSATLGELGLDSLMAVEIRQYIEREYDVSMNMQEIRALTIGKIREIGENGKPTGKKEGADQASSSEAPTTRVVDSYASTAASIEAKVKSSASKAIEDMFDRSNIGDFTPQLRLPKRDHIRLNRCASGRPVFFLPPIHGSFRQLMQVCANIKRPCIGLHWTRKQGRAKSVDEVVDSYLEFLERADWSNEFQVNCSSDDKLQVVDLVGYSFGATIAFELMMAIQKQAEKRAAKAKTNGNGKSTYNKLVLGNLVMLDGSPKHFEIGQNLMVGLDNEVKMDLSEKVDEILIGYMHMHTKGMEVDYLKLKQELGERKLAAKVELASSTLAKLLQDAHGQVNGNSEGTNGKHDISSDSEDDCDDYHLANTKRGVDASEIAEAMEAFCRRYDIIHNYQSINKLDTDCTLIRAKDSFLNDQKAEKDLGLSSVVNGKLTLKIMSGNHDTFLDENYIDISNIIAQE